MKIEKSRLISEASPQPVTSQGNNYKADKGGIFVIKLEGVKVRVVNIYGEPWFVAKDICQALKVVAQKEMLLKASMLSLKNCAHKLRIAQGFETSTRQCAICAEYLSDITGPSSEFFKSLKKGSFKIANWLLTIDEYQPLGSMPCRISSLRANAFNQFPKLTPSRKAASFNCSLNSDAMRNWKVGDKPSPLGVLSLLIVDMYVRNLLIWSFLCTYVSTTYVKMTTPRKCLQPLPGRLTKPLIEVTIMAGTQHTQTRPKFQYRFLAIDRANRKATPCRLTVEAHTEQEARLILCAHFILSFAARLPAKEDARV